MDHRQKIADVARAHAGCSAHVRQELYIDVIVPPTDRAPGRIEYFVGLHPPSTCALFADGVLRLAGVEDPPIVGHYVVGSAIANLENVASAHRALRAGTPDRPLHTGDVAVIDDGSGTDAHVMVFVGEVLVDSGGYDVDTVEGGQLPDSSGIVAFRRTLHNVNGRIYCGHRYVVAWVDADALPIGDDLVEPVDGFAREGATSRTAGGLSGQVARDGRGAS